MDSAGYSPEIHQEGWRRYHLISGYVGGGAPPLGVPNDPKVHGAVAELGRLESKHIPKIDGILGHDFPDQYHILFDDLRKDPPDPLVEWSDLLARIAALEAGKDADGNPRPKHQHKQDQAALQAIAVILTPDVRKQVAALIKQAEATPTVAAGASAPAPAITREQHHADLLLAWGWYRQWAQAAHSEITRRDLLIRLGLAKRKPAEKKDKPAPPVTAPVAAATGTGT